jgi:hypothetical protein
MFYLLLRIILIYILFRFIFKVIYFFIGLNRYRENTYQRDRKESGFKESKILDVESKELD